MFLPIGHDELRFNIYNPPYITMAIILACTVVYLFTFGDLADVVAPDPTVKSIWADEIDYREVSKEELEARMIDPGVAREYGYLPDSDSLHGFLTHQFLHGDLSHLLMNMFFFLMLGIRFEILWSRPVFLGAYLLFGVAGAAVHGVCTSTELVPVIGASGSISGLIGAFLVRYPRSKIHFLVFILYKAVYLPIPAMVILPLFFVGEVISGIGGDGGVAYWCHAGGFAAGVVFTLLTRIARLEERVEGGFLDIFRYRLAPRTMGVPVDDREPGTSAPSRSGDAAGVVADTRRDVHELLNVRLESGHVEGTILINHELRLEASDATVVALGKLGSFDPVQAERLLPEIQPVETDALLISLRVDTKRDSRADTGTILILIDRPDPFDESVSNGGEVRKIKWMRKARQILKLFGSHPSVRTPQCSNGDSLPRFDGIEDFVDQLDEARC